MADFRVGGTCLRAFVARGGDRPWLTCLHCLATSSLLWEPQLAALSRTFRVLRIDARGHGGSDAPEGPYDFATLVADVVGVWDELGIERSAVLGLSMGGMTGFGLALDRPRRVTRLVAADCRADAPEFFRAMWTERRRLVAEGGLAAIADATIATWLTPETLKGRPDLVAGVRAMILGTSTAGYLGSTAALQGLDYKRRLGRIACPTLLVVGAKDGPHPVEMRAMAALIPGARLSEIAGAAHLSNLEQPDAFDAAVVPFLAS
jgi:3-oxoadipate enol-lactonase